MLPTGNKVIRLLTAGTQPFCLKCHCLTEFPSACDGVMSVIPNRSCISLLVVPVALADSVSSTVLWMKLNLLLTSDSHCPSCNTDQGVYGFWE